MVTSVSVILDNGNGSKTVYTDAVGKPIGKPANSGELASPINLLNPDRYEFYTFDDNGDLVKRLMSLDEIKGIIATGDSDGLDLDSFTSQGYLPERKVNEVVNTVQNVLKGEMETHKNTLETNLTFDTPDVSDSWSMILPAVFGNSGEDIKPEKPIVHVTPDTIMLEPNSPNFTMLPSKNITASIATSSATKTTPAAPTIASINESLNSIKQPSTVAFTMENMSTTQRPKVTPPKIEHSSQPAKEKIKISLSTYLSTMPTLRPLTSVELPASTTRYSPPSLATSAIKATNPHKEQFSSSTTSLDTTNDRYIYTDRTTTSSSVFSTETATKNSEQISTWRPSFTEPIKEELQHSTTNTEGLTTFFTVSEERNKITEKPQDEQTKSVPTTDKSSTEDLNTLSTEYLYPGNFPTSVKETLPLEQSMSNIDKLSASALLDQILFTTNVYEINTELSENSINEINTDQKFDTNTQVIPQQPTNIPTTEKFLIQLSDQAAEPNLIQNIDHLLSQAVNNVEELLNNVNNTEKIQELLNNSYNKPMLQHQKESATIVSDMIDQTIPFSSYQTTSVEMDTRETSETQNINTTPNISVVKESKNSITSTQPDSDFDNISSTQSTFSNTEIITQSPTTQDELVLLEINTTPTENQKVPEIVKVTQPTLPFKTSTLKEENVPPLINITIIATENLKNRPKPQASNNLYYKSENSIKNMTEGESTEIYIESVFNVSKPVNESEKEIGNRLGISTTETEKSSETAFTPPNIETTTIFKNFDEDSQTDSANKQSNNNSTVLNKDNNEFFINKATTPNFVTERTTISATTLLTTNKLYTSNKPTTILIVKRTERPPQPDTTTYFPETTEQILTTNKVKDSFTDSNSVGVNNFNNESSVADLFTLLFPTEKTNHSITDEDVTSIMPVQSSSHSSTSINSSEKTYNSSSTVESVNIDQESVTTTENISTTVGEHSTDSNENYQIKKNEVNKTPGQITSNQSESTWTLVPTILPHTNPISQNAPPPMQNFPDIIEPSAPVDLGPNPMQGFGLEESTTNLDNDIYQFAQLCNELAFGFWKTVTSSISSARSVFVSPFGVTSLLAMVFLGARGATSGEMNEILKLDDMVTFNPHLTFKSVSESVKSESNSGVATSAIIRELFSDRSKGKLLPFYKERVRAFYDGYVEEVGFREISDIIRRRTNLQVKKLSGGKITEFWKENFINLKPPLAGVSVNLFQVSIHFFSV